MLRVNMAALLPFLRESQGYSVAKLGIVASAFFVMYMFGQLANGFLGDRLSLRLMIISGLTLSAITNIACAFTTSVTALALLWGFNGAVQSMLWAPLMRLLAMWHDKDELQKVSFYMSLTSVVGYAAAWTISYVLSLLLSWRAAFIIPSTMVLLFIPLPLLFLRLPSRHAASQTEDEASAPAENEPLPRRWYLTLLPLYALIPVALSQGLIREGIGVWFPTMLSEVSGPIKALEAIVLFAVPIVNFLGILAVRNIYKKLLYNSVRALMVVFSLSGGLALLAYFLARFSSSAGLAASVALLALISGLTPILTSIIPFKYAKFGRVSTVAGLTDFLIYCGAALSSVLTSAVAQGEGWHSVMLMWAGFALTGTVFAAIWRYAETKNKAL